MLPIPIYCWKNFSIDFMTGLLISIHWKDDSYNAIFVMIDCLIKMVYYKPVKTTIDAAGLAKVIINLVIRHNSFFKSIISDKDSLFTSKFWFLLC